MFAKKAYAFLADFLLLGAALLADFFAVLRFGAALRVAFLRTVRFLAEPTAFFLRITMSVSFFYG